MIDYHRGSFRLHYESTIHGISEREIAKEGGEDDVIYFGYIHRVPESEMKQEQFKEWLILPREVNFPPSIEPIPGGVVEMYEVFDKDGSGDFLGLWRIPCREVDTV